MTKGEILRRLGQLVHRAKGVARCSAELGWEVLEFERELEKFEEALAHQADEHMAGRYRIHNAQTERFNMKKASGLIVLVALLLYPSIARAQASMVAQKKAELGLTSNLNKAELHSLAKAVARASGGLLLVPTGENCNGYSCDKICLAGRVIDYLGDSEGSAVPAWSDIGPVGTLQCAPVPGDPPGTQPPPSNPPPTTEPPSIPVGELLKPVLQELAALRLQLASLQTEITKLREQGITTRIKW